MLELFAVFTSVFLFPELMDEIEMIPCRSKSRSRRDSLGKATAIWFEVNINYQYIGCMLRKV